MSWTDEQLTDMFGDDPVGKLAFLTGCYKHSINNSPYDGWIISDDNLRKFAELIVRECARAVNKVYEDAEPDHGWPDWATFAPQGSDVLKHFGVEE
jgi:hypothetical protein